MMLKNISLVFIVMGAVILHSCNLIEVPDDDDKRFVDEEFPSILEYLESNYYEYSSFLSIMEVGELDIALSANNPHGNGYTLFLPDNNAIDEYISNSSQFSSLEEVLNDVGFSREFCRYHVLNMSIRSNNFPFGAFPQKTLTEDYLTVSFYAEVDSAYYKINNQSTVIRPNIELSNGYIHKIQKALKPITFTTYDWLDQNTTFSIFKAAVDLCGFDSILKFNADADKTLAEHTLLVESDEVFRRKGILSISDLENFISPGNTNYLDKENPLHNFVGYHILIGNKFIDDFEGTSTLYNTLGSVPLSINGKEIDLAINKGREIFDTIIYLGDTVYIDYVGILYDESNVLTQSGAIHFIDQLMRVKTPIRESKNYDFTENLFINDRKNEPGTYFIEDKDVLNYINWTGSDLYYVVSDEKINAWGNNYLEIIGDFEISYEIEQKIPGQYELHIRAQSFSSANAFVEVFVDGEKVGGLIDFTKGGNSNNPFNTKYIGNVNFTTYDTHIVEIKTLIPGTFQWDAVRFVPI